MPKSSRPASPAASPAAKASITAPADAPSTAPSPNGEEPVFPLDVLRGRADRLARTAREACRQHERCAQYSSRVEVENSEIAAVLEMTVLANRQLADATDAYEKASARLHPDGEDGAWWHRANALWLAAREHVRRHSLGDRLSRRAGSGPSPESLGQLTVEYALEASAILSLKQAVDEYCKARPVS